MPRGITLLDPDYRGERPRWLTTASVVTAWWRCPALAGTAPGAVDALVAGSPLMPAQHPLVESESGSRLPRS
jgi:hypothetical protein